MAEGFEQIALLNMLDAAESFKSQALHVSGSGLNVFSFSMVIFVVLFYFRE